MFGSMTQEQLVPRPAVDAHTYTSAEIDMLQYTVFKIYQQGFTWFLHVSP